MQAPSITKWQPKVRLSGSSALALSTVGTNLVRLASTICLTRLLSPDVYGIIGIIMSIFYTINMLTDTGLQAYVVRNNRSSEPEFLDSVFTIHALRGIALAAVAMLLAWPLSVLMAKPQLFAPLLVSSLFFVIDGQMSLHQFRALQEGKVHRFAMMDLVAGLTQTVTAIALAFLLRNVWAIVGAILISNAVKALASYKLFSGPRHHFRRDRDVALDLWKFSRVVAISSSVMLLVGQFDKLALGRMLSLDNFGIYILAASLAGAPVPFAYKYASTIVFPAVASNFRHGLSIAQAYYGSRRRYFYLYAFCGGGLIGAADLLVRLLYDKRYLAAGPYLSILAVSTALYMTTSSIEQLDLAKGRPRTQMEMNMVRLAWLLLGGTFAIVCGNPLLIVLAIGFVEVAAYAYGIWRLTKTHVISWRRESTLLATIMLGTVVGGGVSYMGRLLLPNI